MDVQSKKKSLWGSFKNTYLRPKNLKNFWKNLRKDNLSKDLIDTLNLYINSESYKMSSKYWRHLTINQLGLLANKKYNDPSITSTKPMLITSTSNINFEYLFHQRIFHKLHLEQ